MRGRVRSPLAVAALVALIGSLAVEGGRLAGVLESAELAAHDWYVRLRPAPATPDPRLVLVTVSERDIRRQGAWPLADGVVADALEALLRHRPRAVGLDIYRDVPVPPGTARLAALLKADRRIVAVMKFGEGSSPGVRPPAVLDGSEQVGFNDILVDRGGTVRRGLLFLDDGTTVASSFALRLALLHLDANGIRPGPDADDPRHLRLGAVTIRALERDDGPYVRADTRGYQFLLDFKSAPEPQPFATVDLASVLSGTLEAAAVADRIVLIGVTADSIKDTFYTPHSPGLPAGHATPGIAIHAHIVSQLLRMGMDGDRPMRTLTEGQEAAWILVWSGLGALLGLAVRSPWWLGFIGAAGVLAIGSGTFAAFIQAWWLPVVPAATAWLLSAGGVTAYLSYRDMQQRTDLMQLFSRHVSREVAEAIWQQREQFLDGARPRSQQLVVTALFTDLSGYTTVSERTSPDALMEWLNEYMDAMAREVAAHGGVIRQYAGDSVVAVFGIPVARHTEREVAQDAVNAVSCALAMESTLRRLNRRWRAEGKPITGMRVGIFTGPVVAGTLGSAERSEYVVVGDTMNTASRLESFDKELFPPDVDLSPCRILVGDATLAHLGGRFPVERLGDVYLKGKEHPVTIYRIVGPPDPGAVGGDTLVEKTT